MNAILLKLALTLNVLSVVLAATPSNEIALNPPINATTTVFTITAYNAEPGQTDSTPTSTASGTEVRNGIVACPRRYPFGTEFLIKGKWYVCEDRLSERFDGRLDIFMESKADALLWGKQRLEVAVKAPEVAQK